MPRLKLHQIVLAFGRFCRVDRLRRKQLKQPKLLKLLLPRALPMPPQTPPPFQPSKFCRCF